MSTQEVQYANAKVVGTPLRSHFKPSEGQSPMTDAEKEYMARVPYASVIGSLNYAMVCTRPDVAHAVGVGYVDADFVGDYDTKRITTCYIYTLGSTAVSWVSRLQKIVTLPTTKGRLSSVQEPVPRRPSNIDCWLQAPDFYHNSLAPSVGMIVLDLLCTCAAVTYPDQVPVAHQITEPIPWPTLARFQILEGLQREIHGMAEQMRIMKENNGRLMQLLAAANPPLPAAPVLDIERSRPSNRSGDRSQNISTERVRGRRRAPSPSLHERSSSTESSKTPTRARRGRSPHRGDHIDVRNKSTSQKNRDLDARLDAINTGTNAPVTVDTLIRQTELPFTRRVMRARISLKFKLPAQLGVYEGKTDPMDHLGSYKSLMSLQGCSDEVMCEAFSATLKGSARSWFQKLSPGTIDPFGDLSRLFVANFMSCRNRQMNAFHLFTIHQKETESLKDFDSDLVRCSIPSPKTFLKHYPPSKVKRTSIIAAEELVEAKLRRRGKDDHKRKEPDTRRIDYRDETRYKRPDQNPKHSNDRRPRTPPRRPEFILPPLNAPVAQGLSAEICRYSPTPNSPKRRYGDNMPTSGDIQTIHGGFGSGGCSTLSKKKHARSALRLAEEEIYNLSSLSVGDQTPITVSNDDLRGLHLPHDDALVVSAVIANFNVQRILIDNGSSADILFISAFERMKIGQDKLHPFHTPLIGFGGNTTHPLGWINLPIILGTEPHQTTVWQDFIVVDCPSPYNAILGRPTLGRIKAITSTYHLKSQGDVPGIDPEVVMHKLFTNPKYSPVRQKRRKFAPERLKVIEDEFGLKNAGATYQRLVNKMFKEQIGKTMEVYIDDMLVKSLRSSDHIGHLEEAFSILRRHRMMLNPSKCIFGVSSGKFLGFLVTKRGIELTGRVAALNRFVSKSADKCLPFFKILRKNQIFQWNEESETAFQQLKEYLRSPPLLTVLTSSEDLFVYFIYLAYSKARYPGIEKLAYALMIAARKLRHYFQSHPIIVLTDQPLKQILQRPDTSGRLLKWSIELRLVIQTPFGEQMEYAIRMGFKATNNEAEYEALLAGLRVAVELGAQSLEIFSDSQLVVNQVQRDYLAKDARMMAYLGEIESQPLAKITEKNTWDFVWKHLVCKFGIPRVIISDNARQFDNDKFRNLKARLERSKAEWAEDLPSILWAYHTTSRILTGETPYSMVFGTESVIPVEIGVPSFRTSNFDKESNEAELRLYLDLLEEKREKAEIHQAAYKCQVAKYYNQRVRHRSFLLGDLVLRKVTLSTKESNAGKLGPTWEGPYKVIRVSRPGTYWLEDPNGKALLHP
ncbi:hypothetical protein Acr_00g0051350 [Actinidia rufa]|uniref:RNA-directed DNA polymerase n=1 Tax=Actinidia rufa TaxID=165716 RepID=A0A7J0DMQ6_9ERIC|nr:hypothetical protein Acr_00g0051350 [Actinidia rufa]